MQPARLAFLHGFMGHPTDWDDLRQTFERFGFETSAAEIAPSVDWESGLHQLAGAIPAQSVLVGYSMGARLALGLAIEYPTQFNGLIFISGNPGLESQAARDRRLEADVCMAARLESQPAVDFLNEWYRQPVFDGVSGDVLDAAIENKLRQDSSDWPAILTSLSVAKQPNYWDRLNEIQVPVLAVAGDRDAKYKDIVLRLDSESPYVESNIVADCGHLVHREQPARFVQALRQFLAART